MHTAECHLYLEYDRLRQQESRDLRVNEWVYYLKQQTKVHRLRIENMSAEEWRNFKQNIARSDERTEEYTNCITAEG